MYKLMLSVVVVVVMISLFAGCADKPTLIPPSDKNLRKTNAQFAADAAKRHPYKADAPRGGEAEARAEVDYTLHELSIVNLSKENWTNVEVWVNKNYVIFLPTMEPNQLKKLSFGMLFDDKGNSIPAGNLKTMINKVEIYRDGKMYDVKTKLGD
jgi:predicted small lipoprotein YifL